MHMHMLSSKAHKTCHYFSLPMLHPLPPNQIQFGHDHPLCVFVLCPSSMPRIVLGSKFPRASPIQTRHQLFMAYFHLSMSFPPLPLHACTYLHPTLSPTHKTPIISFIYTYYILFVYRGSDGVLVLAGDVDDVIVFNLRSLTCDFFDQPLPSHMSFASSKTTCGFF